MDEELRPGTSDQRYLRAKNIAVVLSCTLLWAPSSLAQVHTNGFNGSLGWSEYHPSDTTADWSTTSSGSNPACSPREGSQMAKFNSYSASSGDEARISSPGLDLTGAEVAECRFWMYRDSGESGSDDLVKFQITTDGGDTYTTMHELHRYRSGADGWEEKVVPLGYYTTENNVRIALRGRSRYGNNIFIDDLTVTKAVLAAGAEGKDCSGGGDCGSGNCGVDPFGNGRCREDETDCIDANRVPVASGTTLCAGPDLATCNGPDDWSLTDCNYDCDAYLDVHGCEQSGGQYGCVQCVEDCIDIFGISEGCDPGAYCDFHFFYGDCYFKKNDGLSCDSDRECLSDNCVRSPGGTKYCVQAGIHCADDAGGPAADGTDLCFGNDLYTCQSVGWAVFDCYTNCGFYDDVDSCSAGACQACPTSCTGDQECKAGIVCTGGECVGGLPPGSTCTLDSQCDSDHCVDGRCCSDVCTAPCYRCDVDDSGVCRPVPAGDDPDGECPGQGPCDGTCNGTGDCSYPEGAVCDVCAQCNSSGQCLKFVQAGSDPADECPACRVCHGSSPQCVDVAAGEDPLEDCLDSSESSCGLDGTCDGQGACQYWPEGTECGESSCSSGIEQQADTCDGAGRCVDRGTIDCAPFRCADATSCAQDCVSHATCVPEAYCSLLESCAWDMGQGADCDNAVYSGLLRDAACLAGFCFEDNFDGQGAFCTRNPSGCVHDGEIFVAGYALCSGDDWYRVCEGGVPGWGPQVGCQAGFCDAGGGEGSGFRAAGSCASGPGGGCSSTCQSCEPYMAQSESACRESCASSDDCWPSHECTGGQCRVPEGIGEPCSDQADCSAGICVDGYCCENACTGLCWACNLPDRKGFCTPAIQGSDPDEDCAAEPAESCGFTGVCDGQGECQSWPAGQVCGQADCDGSTYSHEAVCDGAGHCIPAGETDCRPGRCTGSGCEDSCSVHEDCDPAGYCGQDGTCSPDLDDGESCEGVVFGDLPADPACQGDFCYADGFSGGGEYCAGEVDSCVAAGEQYPPGFRLCSGDDWFRVCLGGQEGWGPEIECSPAGVCDAGGGLGSGIVPGEICVSGARGGCSAPCQSCYPYRASAPGQCAGACGEDNDCWPGHGCVAGACEPEAGLGQPCVSDADCGGFSCADGVCCNLPCDGACLVCNDPIAFGVCLPAAEGTDPGDDCGPEGGCGGTGLCDGQSACALQPAGVECEPGSCADGVRTSPGLCDGRGACQPGREHACPSGACLDMQCAPVEVDGGTADADGATPDGGDDGGPSLRAEAGPIQVVAPGTPVFLDGSGSKGPEGVILAFLWEQSSGPEQVQLSGSTTPRVSFTPGFEGVYVFRLVVSGGQVTSDPDFTEVHVKAGAAGCECGSRGRIGLPPMVLLVLLALWTAVRRRKRCRGSNA